MRLRRVGQLKHYLIAPPSPRELQRFALRVLSAVPETESFTSPNLRMPITLTRLPNSRVSLRAEVPLPFCQTAHADSLAEFSKAVKLDGYRKGAKIPAGVLIKAVGREAFLEKVAEFIITGTLVETSSPVADISVQVRRLTLRRRPRCRPPGRTVAPCVLRCGGLLPSRGTKTTLSTLPRRVLEQDSEKVVTPKASIVANFSGPNCEPTGPSVYTLEVDVLEKAWYQLSGPSTRFQPSQFPRSRALRCGGRATTASWR